MNTTLEELKIEQVTADISQVVARAEALQVTTPDEAIEATGFLADIKAAKTRSEQARTFLVGPLNEQVKRINAVFKDAATPLAVADHLLRSKVIRFYREQQRAQAREQARLYEEHRLAEETAAEERQQAEETARQAERNAQHDDGSQEHALAARQAAEEATQRSIAVQSVPAIRVAAPRLSHGTAAVRRWHATVMDETQVPREYLTVDMRKINAAVKAGVREIPGVQIEQTTGLAVRAR